MESSEIPTNAERTATEELPRRAGRPASVQIEQILDAAIAIGLGQVTLRRVAQKLGVGVATLYRYVSGRDELVRMASFRLALSRQDAIFRGDGPTHWAEIACAYAESLVAVFSAQPQLIGELAAGRLPAETEIIFLEPFLARLSEAGVDVAEGMRLHNAVAMLAIGAAAGSAASQAVGGSAAMVASMQRALEATDSETYPHVARGLASYGAGERAHWRAALLPMLRGFAQARGETLPEVLCDSLGFGTQTARSAAQEQEASDE